MKVIICGAGIAGLTLGWWLGRDGWDVLIVEKAPGLRAEGYMIDFFGPGYRVAERMELIPRLEAVHYDIPEVCWIDEAQCPLARLDYAEMRRLLDDRLMSLMRGDLERSLYEVLPQSVELRFGCSIAEIHGIEPTAEVALTGGERMNADLLVAADGVHSSVRAHVFGAPGEGFRYLGLHTAAFVFEDAAVHAELGNRFTLLSVLKRQVGLYPLRGNKVATFFVHHAPDAGRPASPAAALDRIYGDLGWLVPASLQHAAKVSEIYYDQVAQIVIPRWSRGCATLIGDAGYAVSLLSGQGASMAMAGSYALAEALRHETTIAGALSRYEQGFRPLVEGRQAAGRRMANWFVPGNAWRMFGRNMALRLTRAPGFGRLLMRSLTAGPSL